MQVSAIVGCFYVRFKHVAWTRPGRLVFSKLGTYTVYHTILYAYLAAFVQALPRLRVASARRGHRFESYTGARTIAAPRVRL